MSVGETLREARVRRGLSCADIADQVKLRASVVAAIEADDFSLCGGEVYARGHVRAIADMLGLDPDPLLSDLR